MQYTSPHEQWYKQLPNQLTLVRILCVPLLLLLYPLDFHALNIVCGFIFAAAALTDWLDGWLARRYDQVTRIGALLDPIADKMLVGASLLLLVHQHHQIILTWLAGILLCRDIGMSALRLVGMEHAIDIPVNAYGKWKTVAQDVAIFCLLINYDLFGLPLIVVGWISLWISLFLSVYSAYLYATAFLQKSKHLKFT